MNKIKNIKKLLSMAVVSLWILSAHAQEEHSFVHTQSDGYEWPQTRRCWITWNVGKIRSLESCFYNTRTTKHYHDGKVWFTAHKDGKTLYAIYALEDDEKLPALIQWTGNLPEGKMTLLKDGRTVKYTVKDGQVCPMDLPK